MSTTQHRVCLYWDIENSTGLRSSLSTVKWEPLRKKTVDLFKECLPSTNVVIGSDPLISGQLQLARIISDNGDGDLAIFASAKDAVETALKFQWKISHQHWDGVPIRVCIGIDSGETMLRVTDDYGVSIPTGKVLDNAARVLGVAVPGQILITARVSADARDHMSQLPEEIRDTEEASEFELRFAKHGFFDYKGRQESDDLLSICEVGIKGLSPFEPPPNSLKCWPCDAHGNRIVAEGPEWQPVQGALVPGNTGGGWELVRKLGMGGFGEAWLAVERRTKALQVFKFPNDPQRARSFFRETTLATFVQNQLSQLGDARHASSIAKVLGMSEEPPHWVASEYYPEGSLLDWCAGRPQGIDALTTEQRIQFMVDLCRAVHAAHEVHVVHRDIKPGNIFVRSGASSGFLQPVLADFGIGCILHPELLDEQGYSRAGLTHPNTLGPGSRTGTSMYVPPEYEKAGARATAKGDVYALGVLLYQMLIGDFTQPWESAQECERRIKDEFLRRVIYKALDSDSHRFATAEQMAVKLESLEKDRAASGEAVLLVTLTETQSKLVEVSGRSRRRKVALAIMGVLMVFAVIGWLFGMYQASVATAESRRANVAKKDAEIALIKAEQQKRAAEEGFESAIESMEALFEKQYLGSIGNTPGVHVREARALQKSLRSQIRNELNVLHLKQPTHRGCLALLFRLEMEEIRVARALLTWKDAAKPVKDADKWMKLLNPTSPEEVDLCADFFFWEPICYYYLDAKKDRSRALSQERLSTVRELRKKYPASHRLQIAEIRLKNLVLVDKGTASQKDFLGLFNEMQQIPDSAFGRIPEGDLDLVMSKLILFGNAFDKEPARLEMPLESLKTYLDLLEKDILNNRAISLFGMENVCERFTQLVNVVAPKLSAAQPAAEVAQKRVLLGRLRGLLKSMKERSHDGPDVFARYGECLDLELRCVAAGTSSRTQKDIVHEQERHRQKAASLASAEGLRQMVEMTLAAASEEKATDEDKARAAAALEDAFPSMRILDLNGMDTLATSNKLTMTISRFDKMSDKDPLVSWCQQFMEHYVVVFKQADRNTRSTNLRNFTGMTNSLLRRWSLEGKENLILDFWRECYRDLNPLDQTAGDQSTLVEQAELVTRAMMNAGQIQEAWQIRDAVVQLCQIMLKERPWDWYLREAAISFYFALGNAFHKQGDVERTYACREAGWRLLAARHGESIDMKRFALLPDKDGSFPPEASKEEQVFFEMWKPGADKGPLKIFVIPCDVNGAKVPVQFYISRGPAGHAGMVQQFAWIKEYRGVSVPQDVQDLLAKLDKIALENKVSFLDLCVDALNYPSSDVESAKEFVKKHHEKISGMDMDGYVKDYASERLRARVREEKPFASNPGRAVKESVEGTIDVTKLDDGSMKAEYILKSVSKLAYGVHNGRFKVIQRLEKQGESWTIAEESKSPVTEVVANPADAGTSNPAPANAGTASSDPAPAPAGSGTSSPAPVSAGTSTSKSASANDEDSVREFVRKHHEKIAGRDVNGYVNDYAVEETRALVKKAKSFASNPISAAQESVEGTIEVTKLEDGRMKAEYILESKARETINGYRRIYSKRLKMTQLLEKREGSWTIAEESAALVSKSAALPAGAGKSVAATHVSTRQIAPPRSPPPSPALVPALAFAK